VDATAADDEALTGAREAVARHDWERCFTLARAARADDVRVEAERLELLADAAWWLGRLDECIDAREGAYRSYEEHDDRRSAGRCAVWLYEQHGQRGRPAIASAWLQRARRALEDDRHCPEHGALLLREAELAHGGGRLDDAADLAQHALVLGRALRSADLEAEALQTIGRVLVDGGDVERGLAHLDEAMLLAVEGRLGPYSTGKVYCSLISACEDVGDVRRAAEWTDATARWARRHSFAIFPGICRIHRAAVLDRTGALTDAERELTVACSELQASHLPNAAAAYAEAGDVRRRLGDLAGSEDAFARVEQLTGRVCAGTALLRLAQGRADDAARIVDDCVADMPANPLARARLLPVAVQIAIAIGDLRSARTRADELASIAATFDTPLVRASTALARGRVELADGDAARACATLREALARWQDLEVPYEIATTRTVLGQALRETGDDDAARDSFAAARTLFDRVGARPDADHAGVAACDRGRPLPRGLTTREAEVLRLVATGRSNKEIAARLGLSVKTVSRHLSNIFTKIDVSSRAAATAFAFEHGIARGSS
jgi:ATP/maltotriose-dependent transcriptional regulator MalT